MNDNEQEQSENNSNETKEIQSNIAVNVNGSNGIKKDK